MKWFLLLFVFFFSSSALGAAVTAKSYNLGSDKTGSVSLPSFWGNDGKTYVFQGDPSTFAFPVNVVSSSAGTGPLQFLRDLTATSVTLDTVTAANNRPLPTMLISGDSQAPVSSLQRLPVDHITARKTVRVTINTAGATTPIAVSTLNEAGLGTVLMISSGATGAGGPQVALEARVSSLAAWTELSTWEPDSLAFNSVFFNPLPNYADLTGFADFRFNCSSNCTGPMFIDVNYGQSVSNIIPNAAIYQGAQQATLLSLNNKFPTLGQQSVSGSVAVVLPTSQITTLTPQTNALTDAQLRASAVPVSLASAPLPTGAATETTLSSLNSKVTAVDTGAVIVSSSALPSGASTSALQTTGNSSLSSVDGKITSNYGVATGAIRAASQIGNTSGEADFGSGASSAQTLRVITSTDSPNTRLGKSVILTVRQSLSSNTIDTSYDQITASTGATISKCSVFWPGNEPLWLSTGAAASEVVLVYVPAGGQDDLPVSIASGTRLSWRSEASVFSSGYGVITCYGI